MYLKVILKIVFICIIAFSGQYAFCADTTPPTFWAFSPKNNSLVPKGDFEIIVPHSDEWWSWINLSSNSYWLYKWENGYFSNIKQDYISLSNISLTETTYWFKKPLPYWKYLFLVSISDYSWNVSIAFSYFYVDEPKITLNKSAFNSTVWVDDKTYDKLICNVETVWAPYKLEIFKETDLKNSYWNIIQDWDWTTWVWYVLNQNNDEIIHNIQWSKEFANNTPTINENWDLNAYNHEISIATIIGDLQTAWEYNMNFWITGFFDYTNTQTWTIVNGKCWSAINTFWVQPTSNFCSSWISSSLVKLNNWVLGWICYGGNGGSNAICVSTNTTSPQINFVDNYNYFEVFKWQSLDLNSRVTATDNLDWNITTKITKTCTYTYEDIDHWNIICPTTFNNLRHWLYEVTYSVSDSAWNTSTKTAEVLVWDFIKIDSWRYHSVALSSHWKFYTWWWNDSYRQWLGNLTRRESPVLHPLSNSAYIVDVVACDNSWHAIDNNGNLYSWGSNGSYSLGDGTQTTRSTPVTIAPPTWKKYTKVSCFYNTSAALTEDGDVYTWWRSAYWATGDGTSNDLKIPTKLANLSDIVYINMWYYNGWAIDSSGNLYTWWTNGEWQLGVWSAGAISNRGITSYYNKPNNWNSITDAKQICFGTYHALLIKNDGSAYSWWNNAYWRLWNGTDSTNSYSPYKLPITNAIWCNVHTYWSSVFTSSGKAYFFGSNNHWELWLGTTTDTNIPTATALNGVIDTALQLDSWHALVNGTTVYGFWYNWNWELGIGTIGSTSTVTAWDFTAPTILMEIK